MWQAVRLGRGVLFGLAGDVAGAAVCLVGVGVCHPDERVGSARPPAAPAGLQDMGIIGWIVLGLVAGAIAKAVLPGDDPGGIIVTIGIGILGAIVGGFIASALGVGDLDEFFDIGTWLIAIAGSLLLLILYRTVVGRRVR